MILALAVTSCSGSAALSPESDTRCSDGKDNDGDGRIDCEDSDCQATVFCGHRALDAQVVVPQDGAIVDAAGRDLTALFDLRQPDASTPKDLSAQDSASLTPLAYGNRCVFGGSLASSCPASNGQTICIPDPSTTKGFCTVKCAGIGASCPPGPQGQRAECRIQGPDSWYCQFVCLLGTVSYPCPDPSDYKCTYVTTSYAVCRPL